ncbi:MAG: SDR family NAD(P)-dependent oxidoreductase, partial [Actinobacteria bacterium]|nr:SDR family NAD(P)-dependent oxidoreductase [Actinomycetota bacterium]
MFTAHLGATSVGAVLVSGAASGIGRATALRLARGGAAVGLLDRDVAGLTLTAEHAREAGASGVVQAQAD